jgi:hypothetical protein
MKNKTQTAESKYEEVFTQILNASANIILSLKKERKVKNKNWAHVGSLGYVRAQLAEIEAHLNLLIK